MMYNYFQMCDMMIITFFQDDLDLPVKVKAGHIGRWMFYRVVLSMKHLNVQNFNLVFKIYHFVNVIV